MIASASTIKLITRALVVAAVAATLTAGAVAAGTGPDLDPGLVPAQLGSPDPHETALSGISTTGLVAARLGSPDPRDANASR
jgi:hypothetical protein